MRTAIIFLTALAWGAAAHGYDRLTVNLDYISELAQDIAQDKAQDTPAAVPEALRNLKYDDYRNIRFRKSEALWLGQDYRFVVEFLHPGYLYNEPVLIHEITDTHRQQIPFASDFFNYEQAPLDGVRIPPNLGFAGVRIRYPVNNPDVRDDLIVFQGASYFRALGQGLSYGLSARGLGVGIGEEGESFPRFTQLWIKKPDDPAADQLTIYALLEGEHVTGAYAFQLYPGKPTTVDVHARIWPRDHADRLSFAPLTSMFFLGENTAFASNDWRPEVHDSDGLLVATGKDWIWRPLSNPAKLTRKSFRASDLKGFGLLQRDRRFTAYEDLEADYERRPSVWIEPKGAWPAGEVVLVEMPASDETGDNINAFWRPDQAPAKGQFYDLKYQMTWRATEPSNQTASVLETRVGQKTLNPKVTTYAIEFVPPPGINASNVAELKPELDTGKAQLSGEAQIVFNGPENCVRVLFDLKNDAPADELKLSLLHNGQKVSETWSYYATPTNANHVLRGSLSQN